MIIVRGEKPSEIETGYAILTAATGAPAAAQRVAALRGTAEFNANLSLIAELEGQALGYALYYPAVCGAIPAAVLAAIGTRPQARGQGVAERLVRHGLDRCRSLKRDIVFSFENTSFLQPLGFQPAAAHGFRFNVAVPQDQATVIDLTGGGALAKAAGAEVHLAAAII